MGISAKKPIFSEPKCIITGVEGAGKTLFAVQQADLLTTAEGGELYVMNIRGADPVHLPQLPFKIDALAFNDDGSPMMDPETGDHMPMWATLPPGSVIVIDEAHKVYPQRGPGRPPKHIEMMAEGRQHGIRFILLTQAPASLDSFLRDRISRHYHLERKGNMERATVLEFDHCVMYPRTAWQERKDAQVHFWTYPKEYFGWYKSAKSHHFKLRIPWKIWAAIAFVPLVGFVGWRLYDKLGGVMEGAIPTASAAASTAGPSPGVDQPRSARGNERDGIEATADPGKYLGQFLPVIPEMPWSAPVFQGREVVAQPRLLCTISGAGTDALGKHRPGACTCYTEQMTPWAMAETSCRTVARHGMYNPYASSGSQPQNTSGLAQSERGKPGEASSSPSGVRAVTSAALGAGGGQAVAFDAPKRGESGVAVGEADWKP